MFANDTLRQKALSFAIRQSTHIERGVYARKYPEVQYRDLVNIDTSAHEFASTVTHFTSDIHGKAKWINGNADDVPMAGSELGKQQTDVHMAAIGYGWGYEEIGIAQMLGHNLPATDAVAARMAYEKMIDRIALHGDSDKGYEGLFSHSAVTPRNVDTGDWNGSSVTEDQILADVNKHILGVGEDTLFTEMANTLLLPYSKLNLLATTRLGDTNMTVLEFLRKNNTYTAMTGNALTIRGVRGLETAGVGDTARLIAYNKSEDTLKMHIPMPLKFLPAKDIQHLRVEVAGVFRVGGLDIRKPLEVRYGDGI